MLEDRLTPADLTWIGVSPSNFMSYTNWFNAATGTFDTPTANDDLYFVGLQLPPPSGTYPLPQVEGMNPNAHATIPSQLSTLKSVHLVSNYTGTVSTFDNQRLGTLDLQTGDIAQLGAGDGVNDLVITAYLSYIGGTLNSTANTGTVHITGQLTEFLSIPATANIGGETLPTLRIGSTLAVEGIGESVAKLYLDGGVFEFFNGGYVLIAEKGFGQSGPIGAIGGAAIPNELKAVGNTVSGGILVVKGEFNVAKKSPFKASAIYVTHDFAKVTIHDTVTLTAASQEPGAVVAAFGVSAGSVVVDAGIHFYLATTAGVSLSGGSFSTVAVAGTPNVVTIHGIFQQTGGTLSLGGAGTVGAIHVTGDVLLAVGSLASADVDTTTGDSDRIASEGKMGFGAAYAYDVVTAGVPLNTVFLPFRARYGFYGGDNPILPLVAGYAASLNLQAGQDPAIQIKKN